MRPVISTRSNATITRVLFFVSTVVLLTQGVSHRPVYAQNARPRVGVLEIENRTGRDTHGPLADTVRQTILLTLTLLDRYEVVDRDVPRAADIAGQAAVFPVETVLWGEITLDEEDRIAITVTIFDRIEDRIVVTETETASSLLDVFDTADILVGSVIGEFSGTRVGFGTITLDVSGSGDYHVFLDGTDLGGNATRFDRILAGEYRIRVDQELPEGYRTVLEQDIVVEASAPVLVALELLDVDALRAEELVAIASRLEVLLTTPPGSIDALTEIDRTLTRYEMYASEAAASDQASRWYRYRADLQREYRDILDYRYFDGSRARFDRALPRALLFATFALREEVPEGLFTPEQRRVLDEMSRRNRNAFYATMMLAADYQTVLGNVEEQQLPYDILFDLSNDGLSPLPRGTHRPFAERAASVSMSREYATAVERRRPLWHTLLIGAGAVGVGTAGVVFGTGMPWDRIDEGDRTYDRYQASDDPDEAERLRERTEAYYDEANRLFVIGGTAALFGVSAMTTGILARVRSSRRPQIVLDNYISRIGEPRLEAAISFFEGGVDDRLILVRSTRGGSMVGDRRLQIDDRPPLVENGPVVYTDLADGSRVTWTSTSGDAGEFVHEHVVHAGRNVIYVP